MTPGISHNSSHIAIHTFGIDATTHSGAAVAVRNVRNNCKQRCLVDKPLWQNCSNLGSTMFDTSIGSSLPQDACSRKKHAAHQMEIQHTKLVCLLPSYWECFLLIPPRWLTGHVDDPPWSHTAHWSRRSPTNAQRSGYLAALCAVWCRANGDTNQMDQFIQPEAKPIPGM